MVPARRKARLLGRALVTGPFGVQGAAEPPLEAARFLVAAVHGASTGPRRRPLWRRLDDRIAWVAELFERLQQLDLERDHTSGRVE